MKVLKDQSLQPIDSHSLQSYSNGRNEISVLCEEHPPRTFARECLICEFPDNEISREQREGHA